MNSKLFRLASKNVLEMHKMSLEEYIRQNLPLHGYKGVARTLGVSEATVGYWILKLGLRTVTVVISNDEEVRVFKRD